MKSLALTLALAATAFAQQSMKIAAPCESTKQVLSPAGNRLVVQCKDRSVHLLELPSGREIRSESPSIEVTTHEFSPDGRWLGLGFDDGSVEIWSSTADATPIRWNSGKRAVQLMRFGPDRQVLLGGNVSDVNEVWDFTGSPTRRATLKSDFSDFTSAAFSPDGKWLVTTGGDTVVRFFDTATWKQVRENRDLTLEPFAVQFTGNGKQVVVAGADGRLTLIDPDTGKAMRKLPAEDDYIQEIHVVNANQVVAVYMDLDGRKPPHLKLWDLNANTGTPIQIDPGATGGGIADGKVWMMKAGAREIELSSGN